MAQFTAPSLWDSFPPQSLAEWENLLRKSLKDQEPDQLTWHPEPGIQLAPLYQREQLPLPADWLTQQAGSPTFLRGVSTEPEAWQMVQGIDLAGESPLARVQEAREAGMFAFLVEGESVPTELWTHLPLNESAIHLRLSQESLLATTDLLLALAQQGHSRKELTGTLTNDPISTAAALGNRPTALDWVQCEGGIKNTANCPNFRSLGLDLSYVHEQGGTLVEELATALLTIVETLEQLGIHGYLVPDLLPKLAVTFGVGNHFFLEIAKFRAFRLLMSQLLRAYELEETAAYMPFVMAQTSLRLQSQEEPLDNLLPATTQAMSAIFGGVDALFVRACDAVNKSETAESARLARNVQNLLHHESQLHQVQDPVGGSYYLEVATHQLAEAAWKLFQEKEVVGRRR